MTSRREAVWTVLSTASGVGAAMLTTRAVGAVWTKATDRRPPNDPTDASTSWPKAIVWVATVSAVAGVVRLVAQRTAGAAWEAATGSPPPRGPS